MSEKEKGQSENKYSVDDITEESKSSVAVMEPEQQEEMIGPNATNQSDSPVGVQETLSEDGSGSDMAETGEDVSSLAGENELSEMSDLENDSVDEFVDSSVEIADADVKADANEVVEAESGVEDVVGESGESVSVAVEAEEEQASEAELSAEEMTLESNESDNDSAGEEKVEVEDVVGESGESVSVAVEAEEEQASGAELSAKELELANNDSSINDSGLSVDISEEVSGKVKEDRNRDVGSENICRSYSPVIICYHNPDSVIAEQYRALRTMLFSRISEEQFAIAVTSSVDGEGKTLTCLNLGFVLSEYRHKRVLILDCNLRGKGMSKFLGISSHSKGFADMIISGASSEEVVWGTRRENLNIIPSGSIAGSSVAEIFGSERLPEVICRLQNEYDFVLFDLPSVVKYSDAAVLGRLVGGVLFVVKMNSTPKQLVGQGIGFLQSLDVDIKGLVLTNHKKDSMGIAGRFF